MTEEASPYVREPTLSKEIQAAKTLLENYADIIGDDDEAKADFVEGQTSLNEAIDFAVQRLIDDMAAINGLKDTMERLADRQERIKHRADAMRTMLAVAMEHAGRKKIEHPAVTMTMKSAPRTAVIDDEAAIPSKYWRPRPPKLDKRAVTSDLKEKQEIPGAKLSNGGSTLQLRWT